MIYADVCRGLNHIGFLGENEHRTFRFRESAEILAMYPGATVVVMHRRPGDPAAYPVAPGYVTINGGMVCWTVQSGDLAKVGRGKVSVSFFQGDVIAKMIKYDTMIDDALDGSGTPPDPWLAWIMEVVAAGEHAPTIIDGVWWAWSVAEEKYINTQTPATGPQGNGISSVVLNADYTLTITFTNGSSYTTGSIRGEPGQDGHDYVITEADYAAIAAIVAQNAGFQQTKDAVEGMAYGTKDGEPVSSGSPYFHNNAYYFMLLCLAATGHYPKVENGYWYIWDVQNEQWATTGVKATGADGVSPTITITNITGGHRITVTDADGDHTFDVMDGTTPTVPVQDVQVNGTSILSQGVANVPLAASGRLGVVSVGTGLSIGSTGILRPSGGTQNDRKAGTSLYIPVVMASQHESTFYGLTKAAGVDMSSSSNAVGTYTDAAKIAIQKMLGIYEAPWELIREDTFTNATEADYTISVDGNGQQFELTSVIVILIVPTHDEDTNIGDFGRVYLYNGNTEIRRIYLLNAASKLITANSSPNTGIGRLIQENGLMSIDYYLWTVNSNRPSLQIVANNEANGVATPFAVTSSYITSIKIGKITGQMQYRILGKRKWN